MKNYVAYSRLLIAGCVYMALFTVCYASAWLVRFEFILTESTAEKIAMTLPVVLLIKFLMCLSTREWQRRFRYSTFRDVVFAGAGSLCAAGAIYVLTFVSKSGFQLPRSIILIDALLTIVAICTVRATLRTYFQAARAGSGATRDNLRRAIIYDADHGGIGILRAIQTTAPDVCVVAFIDPENRRNGSLIDGIPVFGIASGLADIRNRVDASQILLPANLPGRTVRAIVDECQSCGLEPHVIPAVDQIVSGRFKLSIRDVTINDLLRRNPNQLDIDGIRGYVAERTVLVTGAAGSIGSELCRQLLELGPSRLVFVDQSESGIFAIEQEVKATVSASIDIRFVIGDVTDRDAMRSIIVEEQPSLIFHAAAYKHVPLMEENPQEAIRNNVFGTRNIVDLADECGVERFVLISTDKAVRPTNIMGCTKLVAEKYLQSVSVRSKTKFITVRFGNVLNSAGSVVPTFRRQIEEGGPITVTHPEMRRYFMTIPEAVQLVLQAGAIGTSGDILILDMGEPVKIFDLARDMINLSGLHYPDDIDIVFSGMRPGEKLYEELFYESEENSRRVHEKIFCAPRQNVSPEKMEQTLARLFMATQQSATDAAGALRGIVEGYVHQDSNPVAARQAA